VCVGICYVYNPALGPIDFSKSQEIAAINRGGDGEIRVLGNTVSSHQSISAFGGLLNANFNLPHLDSSSAATLGGFDGVNLPSARRDSVAVVNANIAQIVLDLVAQRIPLSGNLAIGYNPVCQCRASWCRGDATHAVGDARSCSRPVVRIGGGGWPHAGPRFPAGR
jgi:hypothetical protein